MHTRALYWVDTALAGVLLAPTAALLEFGWVGARMLWRCVNARTLTFLLGCVAWCVCHFVR
jgi:hypothetical protein